MGQSVAEKMLLRVQLWCRAFRANFSLALPGICKGSRGVTRWLYSGGIPFALWGATLALPAYGDYSYAYACALFAGVWTLGAWLISDVKAQSFRVFGIISIVVFFSLSAYWVRQKDVGSQLISKTGYLLPGSTRTPVSACGGEPGDYFVVMLGSMVASTASFPATVLSINNEPLLTVDKDKDGRISFSADIFDAENNIVAEIDKGQYDVDSSVFKMTRKDLSSLSVVVRKNKEKVLNIEYLNPHAIRITGIFRRDYKKVEASADGVLVDGNPSMTNFGVCSKYPLKGGLFAF